jgi:RAB6A-GEF complex partner protein 2
LEWKVRLCLLVAVTSPSSLLGASGTRTKHLIQDGPTGEWGLSWRAHTSLSPLEKLDPAVEAKMREEEGKKQSWGAWAASFLGSGGDGGEGAYHDGDAWEEEGEGEGQKGWRELRLERVECEVPIKVWPGNTAFKAMEVVFDV